MPLCVSEAAFFENPAWLKVGFELLQWLATFSRDYLLPKLKPSFAVFEKKMAEYADVVAVSAAILQRAGIPAIAQSFWTEHSERAVLHWTQRARGHGAREGPPQKGGSRKVPIPMPGPMVAGWPSSS